MAQIKEENLLLELQKKNGDIERYFPITKISNILGLEKKLASMLANKEITTKQAAALKILSMNPYLVDDKTADTYKIGINNGKLYFVKVESGPEAIVDEMIEAMEALIAAAEASEEEQSQEP